MMGKDGIKMNGVLFWVLQTSLRKSFVGVGYRDQSFDSFFFQ